MNLPFTAARQIIPRSQKDFPEPGELSNPNGGILSRQPDNSCGTRFPVNPKYRPKTTNCDSFHSSIQIENVHQKRIVADTICGLPVPETCERKTSQTEAVPATTCEPPIHSAVTEHRIKKQNRKKYIGSNQTNGHNPGLGAAATTAIQAPRIITGPKYTRFELNIHINDQPVTMTIDSGCHISIIGKLIWQQLGQPKLEPVTEHWWAATGSPIEFAGKFMANVKYAGKSLHLPLHVMEQSKTINLLGRVWFPSLHLDWNRVFNSFDYSHYQPDSIEQRQLALRMIRSHPTGHFYVDVIVEGRTIRMMLDTGATVSVVSQKTWKKLGKPPLYHTTIPMIDATQKLIPIIGISMVEVDYNGRQGSLPVFVTADDCLSILGTEWFGTMQFDFNSIFENINFRPPRETPIPFPKTKI